VTGPREAAYRHSPDARRTTAFFDEMGLAHLREVPAQQLDPLAGQPISLTAVMPALS
jgi:hypothetical protein